MERVAVVTGARGVLGRAVIGRLAGEGYRVIAHSRSQLEGDLPAALTLSGDLSDASTCDRIRSAVDRVDLLVNNAASQQVAETASLGPDDWRDMMQATFLSAVQLTSALVDAMPEGASVVNVSSVEASSAFPRHAHYAAAKAALESYTRSLSLDLAGRGIRANAVAPGLIDRPGLAEEWPEGHAWWVSASPLARPVRADEVAEAIAFLARASGISGVVLPVDAGWSASARLG